MDDYKTMLTGADLIIHHSHGSTVTINGDNIHVMCIREDNTADKLRQYDGDLRSNDCRVVPTVHASGHYFYLTPNFFTHYYSNNRLNDEVIYIGICSGYGDDGNVDTRLGDAMIGSGASSAYGWVNTVSTYLNIASAEQVAFSLTDGETTGNALQRSHDGYYNYSNFQISDILRNQGFPNTFFSNFTSNSEHLEMVGNADKTIVKTGIMNPDFEESVNMHSSQWNYFGDARIVSRLGNLYPQSGKNMAIITTGLGSAEMGYLNGTEGSGIWQRFRVPSTTKQLRFQYDVISEEPTEYVNSEYDDKFIVELLDENFNLIKQITYESINTSEWEPIDGINFEGGDDTTYHTGWKGMVYDGISEHKNEIVYLRFLVSDVGDSIYDTAALIDNIVLETE